MENKNCHPYFLTNDDWSLKSFLEYLKATNTLTDKSTAHDEWARSIKYLTENAKDASLREKASKLRTVRIIFYFILSKD